MLEAIVMRYEMNSDDKMYLENFYKKLERKLSVQCDRLGSIMPYTTENGQYFDMGQRHLEAWTNGFYCGILWQMYHATKKEKYKVNAEKIEERLDEALTKFVHLDHDVGFQWLHTSVANYRLTNNEKSLERSLHAANILAGRFNIQGNFIRAWNDSEKMGITIIDCLMNLPLLHFAFKETNNYAYKHIAISHADMALEYLIRPDGSCHHIAKFDAKTGAFIENLGGQGYGLNSSWSRGQAWAIYGMALAYRYTKDEKYLNAAKTCAAYFLANIALNDYIALLDFRSPKEPKYIDTTASACAICGLLEIAEFVSELEKSLYVESSLKCIKALEKYCCFDVDKDSILSYGSARYDRASDREVPIIYGDYFLTEGILRLLAKDFLIW